MDLTAADPAHQLRDPERRRPYSVHGREQPAQHVVAAAESAATLHRPEAADFLDDADERGLAAGIAADLAGVGGVQSAAHLTGAHLGRRLGQGLGQRLQQLVAPLQQRQRRPPRRTRAKARQLAQQGDQTLDFRTGGGRQRFAPCPASI